MSTRPSLETVAGLYRAALEQFDAGERAVARVLASAERHGYTEAQLQEAVIASDAATPARVTIL